MKQTQVIPWVVVGAWALVLVLWPNECNQPAESEDARQVASGEVLNPASLTRANFGMLGFHLFETKDGEKYWNIRSEFAELHRQSNYTFMQKVLAQFFSQKTGNTVETRGDHGRAMMDTRRVELEGNVSIKSEQGYLFNLEKLIYEGTSHEFHSDSAVQMVGPNVEEPAMFLRGNGFKARIDEERYFLRRNVVARKRLSNAKWLRVRSRSGEFFSSQERALFKGNVATSLPGVDIESDAFEMKMGGQDESLVARGHVRLKQENRTGTADSASVEVGANVIVLEGRAKVDTKQNRIEGKRIVLYTDEDRVEVTGARGSIEGELKH